MGKHGKPLVSSRYMTEARKGHPTAHADGRVRVHRAVLYDEIGPGLHSCNWCGEVVVWDPQDDRLALVADHLDGDKWNNSPDNLVPSCAACNASRPFREASHCKRGHEWTEENTYTRPEGQRQCRQCMRIRDARKRARRKAAKSND